MTKFNMQSTPQPDFVPKQTRAYRVPEVLKVETEKQIDELLRLGFIEPSNSPMTSGVVCVVKPNKSVRWVVTFDILTFLLFQALCR